jgi:hypothetical protein
MKEGSHRPVLLVGSVPLKPASEVFRVATHYLGEVMARFPDGEQVGWLPGVWQRMAENPALEPTRKVALVGARDSTDFFSQLAIQYYGVKPGSVKQGLTLGPYGIAENAIASYRQFKQMKESAVVPRQARFQATLPGPLDCAFVVELPKGELFPLAEEATAREISAITAAIPADDLTIQVDLAFEVELEEYRRRPKDFDMPVYEGSIGRWTTKPRLSPISAIAFHQTSSWAFTCVRSGTSTKARDRTTMSMSIGAMRCRGRLIARSATFTCRRFRSIKPRILRRCGGSSFTRKRNSFSASSTWMTDLKVHAAELRRPLRRSQISASELSADWLSQVARKQLTLTPWKRYSRSTAKSRSFERVLVRG